MSRGFVYILSNPFMPNVVKIGKTTRSVEQRANELFQTGLPAPFKIESEFATPDCGDLERMVHEALGAVRVNSSREFFNIGVLEATQKVMDLHREQIDYWLDQYLPGHTAVEDLCFIDPSTVYFCAEKTNLPTYSMDQVICQLTAEELAPAARRYMEACERRKVRVAAGLPAWPQSEQHGVVSDL